MDIREIMDNYGDKPGGLIEAYHAIQKELNYLPGRLSQKQPGYLVFLKPRPMV